jgi:hypothetical protein
MNILKTLKWWFVDQFMFYGGDGGGGGPQNTKTETSNIPEYARPYVENMLASTQKQIYTTDANGQQTGFRPYQPYSTNPNDYVAGFSPLQQQSQAAVANLQTPDQYGAGSSLAGMAGLGSLGVAGQAAGAGQQYNQMAQDPRSMQGFMSPYMQNVVDYQKQSAMRDYGIGQQGLKAQAARSGSFGGSRHAIQEAEAQRSLGSQLQGIEAQGAQTAFQNAQQAQQFGANLGMQGYNSALQGLGQANQAAGTLGQLGTAQLGAQSNIAQLQSQAGAQQQAQEQQKINQSIQDYATAQQYPYMQLGVMNSMLRGLPLQSSTTQMYQAQPSTGQQLLGYGLGALGAYKAFG